MKSYLLLFLFFLTANSEADVSHPERKALSDFEERLKLIDQSVPLKEQVLNSLKDASKEIAEFNHPHLIKKDLDTLATIQKASQEIVQSADHDLALIFTDRIREDVSALKSKIDEREKYLRFEEGRQRIETQNAAYSDRLKKYIQLIKDSKYGLAKALSLTLNSTEKALADEYMSLNTYLIQQFNVQEPLEKNIADLEKKIEESLSFPEGYLKNIDLQKQKFQNQQTAFLALKNELTLDQFDIKFDYWKMGYFNCGKASRYFRPLKDPNLLFLMNDANLSSVLRMNPTDPANPQVIYSCKKAGTFGSCLDNEQKELCRLDSECAQVLADMEASYDRKQFFQASLPTYPASVITGLQDRYRNSDKSFLRLMEKEKRLGSLSLEELLAKMNPLKESLSGIKAASPEEFIAKAKSIVEKEKQKNLKLIPPGQKLEDTKRSVGYLYASVMSELESIQNDDTLQDLLNEKCAELPERAAFCKANALWKEKATVFNNRIEMKNLTPDECPRGVFRFSPLDPVEVKNQCEESTEESSISDLKNFIDKLKATDDKFWN